MGFEPRRRFLESEVSTQPRAGATLCSRRRTVGRGGPSEKWRKRRRRDLCGSWEGGLKRVPLASALFGYNLSRGSKRVHTEGVDSGSTATYVSRRGYSDKGKVCRHQLLKSLAPARVVNIHDTHFFCSPPSSRCFLSLSPAKRDAGASLLRLFLAAGSAAEQCGRRGCQLGGGGLRMVRGRDPLTHRGGDETPRLSSLQHSHFTPAKQHWLSRAWPWTWRCPVKHRRLLASRKFLLLPLLAATKLTVSPLSLPLTLATDALLRQRPRCRVLFYFLKWYFNDFCGKMKAHVLKKSYMSPLKT